MTKKIMPAAVAAAVAVLLAAYNIKAKETAFTMPSAFEGEHITIDCSLETNPEFHRGVSLTPVATDQGEKAIIVMTESDPALRKGTRVRVHGEIVGRYKEYPIIDDVKISEEK